MRINVRKKSRALETISKNDILVFGDGREEVVEEVSAKLGHLYTNRLVDTSDKEVPFLKEFVAYCNIKKIELNSPGQVYDFTWWRIQ